MKSPILTLAFVKPHFFKSSWVETKVQFVAVSRGLVFKIFMDSFCIGHVPKGLTEQRAYLFQRIAPTEGTAGSPEACSHANEDADRALGSVLLLIGLCGCLNSVGRIWNCAASIVPGPDFSPCPVAGVVGHDGTIHEDRT
jgi:hypothetical protein